jgi:hypothetical protein
MLYFIPPPSYICYTVAALLHFAFHTVSPMTFTLSPLFQHMHKSQHASPSSSACPSALHISIAVKHYTTITFWFTAALPPLYGSSNTVKAAAVSA